MVEKLRIFKKSTLRASKDYLTTLIQNLQLSCPVELNILQKPEAEIEFDEDRRILLTNNTMKALLNTYGRDNLELMYHR